MELDHDQEVALLELEFIILTVMAWMLNLRLANLRKHVSCHLFTANMSYI